VSDLLDTVRLFGPAFAGSLLVALACAVVGVHVVGRRIVLTGLALPQVAAAGIGVSILAGTASWTAPGSPLSFLRSHDAMALLACLAGAAALAEAPGARRGARDVRTAAAYCLAGALSFLLMLRTAEGMEEVRHLVAGEVLGIHAGRLWELAAYLVPVVVVHVVLHRRFLFVSFDPEMAATLGIRTRLHDLLFYGSLAVTVARSVHAAGILFVFAFLVLPAAGAMRVARRTWAVFVVAAALALVGSAAGFLVAADERLDWPIGPTATAAVFLLFLACVAVRAILDRVAAKAPPRSTSEGPATASRP
jgi:ABC-type Mn2+/Zn2+ transport system permease subunit